MVIIEMVYSAAANKCPRCHKGKIFEKNSPYSLHHSLKMKDSCEVCRLKYEREPGFFYGAMYVSYALMSGLFIAWFVSNLLWMKLGPGPLLALVIGSMVLAFPVVYRTARIVWLNFFVRYNKNWNSAERTEQGAARANPGDDIYVA